MERNEDAISSYEKAHAAEKFYLKPLKRMADYYEMVGDKESQLQQLKKLDNLSPLNIERKVEIGQLNMDAGRIEEAEEYFKESIKITKKQMKEKVANINLDVAERMMKTNPEKAEEYFREALETKKDVLDKEDIHLFNRLGMALRKQKKPKEAIDEYKRALKISPEDENLYYNIALAYIENKEPAIAESYIKKCIQINPDMHKGNYTVSYSIALIYYQNQNYEKAKLYAEQALKLSADYKPAKQILEKINKSTTSKINVGF
jgi:tetratricopeptide (TPR) repeat protein